MDPLKWLRKKGPRDSAITSWRLIRTMRERAGVSRKALAAGTGISENRLYQFEHDQTSANPLSSGDVQRIVDFLRTKAPGPKR